MKEKVSSRFNLTPSPLAGEGWGEGFLVDGEGFLVDGEGFLVDGEGF